MKQQTAPSDAQRSDKREEESSNRSEIEDDKLVDEDIGYVVGSAHTSDKPAVFAMCNVKLAVE